MISNRLAKGRSSNHGCKPTLLREGVQRACLQINEACGRGFETARIVACPQIKDASRRDFENARIGLVLKLRKQADVTSERHAKGLSSNQGSKQTLLRKGTQWAVTSKSLAKGRDYEKSCKGLVLKSR